MTLRIAGGRVYDPANGVAGEVRDVCLSDGKVVDDVPADAPRIDARGMVVMPGGVDIHAHIAGPKVNAARRLAPEEHRGDVQRPHGDPALGHRRHRAVDVRHRLPLRAARLHDGRRGGDAAARRAPRPLRAARHADDRRPLPRAAGQQRRAVRPHPPRPGARARRGRVVAGGDGRLRRQARQPGRRRALEARQRQRHLARRRRRRRHAAAGASTRSPAAVHELGLPHPVHVHCNNLGVARQLAHDARHAAHARGPARASRAPPVPRLRRQAGRAAALARAGARRVPRRRIPSSAPTSGR